jgi:hypothetical protein
MTTVKIRETGFYGKTVVEIVDADTGEVLAADSFAGKWGTLDYQRGWWMAKCDENDWTVIP